MNLTDVQLLKRYIYTIERALPSQKYYLYKGLYIFEFCGFMSCSLVFLFSYCLNLEEFNIANRYYQISVNYKSPVTWIIVICSSIGSLLIILFWMSWSSWSWNCSKWSSSSKSILGNIIDCFKDTDCSSLVIVLKIVAGGAASSNSYSLFNEIFDGGVHTDQDLSWGTGCVTYGQLGPWILAFEEIEKPLHQNKTCFTLLIENIKSKLGTQVDNNKFKKRQWTNISSKQLTAFYEKKT